MRECRGSPSAERECARLLKQLSLVTSCDELPGEESEIRKTRTRPPRHVWSSPRRVWSGELRRSGSVPHAVDGEELGELLDRPAL